MANRKLSRKMLILWFSGVCLLYAILPPSPVYHLPEEETVFSISPKGSYLATIRTTNVLGSYYAPLTIRNAKTGKLVWSLGDHSQIKRVEFTHDEKFILADIDDRVIAWNLESGEKVFKEPESFLHSMIAPEGDAIAILIAEIEGPRYFQRTPGVVRVIEVSSGQEIARFGSVSITEATQITTIENTASLELSSDGRRGVTIAHQELDQELEDQKHEMIFQFWDLSTGRNLDSLDVPMSWFALRAFALDEKGENLWLASYSDKQREYLAPQLHRYDLEELSLVSQFAAEKETTAHLALTNMPDIKCMSENTLKVKNIAGEFWFDTTGEQLEFLAADGLGHIVSEDGKLWAYESGEVVDASPPFYYHKKNRQLKVVTTQTEEVLFESESTDETTVQTQHKPLAFSGNNNLLIFEKYQDSIWGLVRKICADLVQLRLPNFKRRPSEIRCVDMATGDEWCVANQGSNNYYRGAVLLPGDEYLYVRRSVFGTSGSKRWLTILLFPTFCAYISHRLANRKSRHKTESSFRRD